MHPLLSQLFYVIAVKTLHAQSEFSWQHCSYTQGVWLSVGEWNHSKAQRLTAPNRWRSPSVPCSPVSLSTFPLLFCWFVYFWFLYNQEPLELRGWRGLDIIWRRQRMRGTAWDRTPQACCRGPAKAGCQEWLRGPSGTSLRHLTSALQLSPALTLSRLKTHMELRQERASGTWSITLCHIIRISPIRIFCTHTSCGGSFVTKLKL